MADIVNVVVLVDKRDVKYFASFDRSNKRIGWTTEFIGAKVFKDIKDAHDYVERRQIPRGKVGIKVVNAYECHDVMKSDGSYFIGKFYTRNQEQACSIQEAKDKFILTLASQIAEVQNITEVI